MSNSDKVAWDTPELPQGDAKAKVVQNMFDAIAPRYDMVNRIMTFRLDTRWRKIAVRKLALAKGARVLDLASGTGDLCVDLRKAGLIPLSFDMSFGMLAADHSKAPRVQADILRLPIAAQSVDLNVFFHEIARVTKPGGRIALLDVSTPTNPLIRWGNSVYFGKVVPRIGGLLSNRAAYNYLPKSVAYLPSPEQLVVMLQNAGFEHVRHEQLSGGLTQLMHATKK